MKPDDLKKLILSLTQDVTFEFEGEYACINPYNSKKIEAGYGGKVKAYGDIDEVMNDNFYHGKSLKDICSQLQID